jgi:hypothetical protein
MPAIIRPPIDLDAKRTEIQNYINQTFVNLQQDEPHIDVQEQRFNRNVLLVGPSKSGKTTLRRVLNDPRYVSEELSLRSLSNTMSSCERNIKPSSVPVSINIVELPEKMISPTSNLLMINEECTRLGIHDFHMICLCISFDAGIDGIAIQSFERFINHFDRKQLSPNLCLIITRCESKNDKQREKLSNEVMQDIDFSKVMQYLGRGIHFSGALNRDSWNGASEALYNQFETVYDYRKNLLKLITEDIKPFQIQPMSLQSEIRSPLPKRRYFSYSLMPISSMSRYQAEILNSRLILKIIICDFRKDQTDSLQASSKSVESPATQSSVSSQMAPLVQSKQESTVRHQIPSQNYHLNRSSEPATAETPLLSNSALPILSRLIFRLREYVFSSSHMISSLQCVPTI